MTHSSVRYCWHCQWIRGRRSLESKRLALDAQALAILVRVAQILQHAANAEKLATMSFSVAESLLHALLQTIRMLHHLYQLTHHPSRPQLLPRMSSTSRPLSQLCDYPADRRKCMHLKTTLFALSSPSMYATSSQGSAGQFMHCWIRGVIEM